MTDKGMSVIMVASSLGIREGLMRKWKERGEAKGDEAFPGHGNQINRDSAVARLMEENRRMRMEGDILKKRRCWGLQNDTRTDQSQSLQQIA